MTLSGPTLEVDSSTERASWRTLLDMLRSTALKHPDRGIYLTDERGGHEFRTYAQIAEGALRVGAGMAKRGITRRDRVVLALPSSFDFISAFFGALSIGAIPIPIAAPVETPGASRAVQAEFFVRFSERMNASAVLFRTAVGSAVKPPKYGALKHVMDIPQLLEGVPVGAAPLEERPLTDVAYIQTTSGETAKRGTVELTHSGILANLEATGAAIDVTTNDFGVSWLPLFNTMGLVGGLLFNIYWGLDMALIAPERFMRRPEDWLHAISRHGGTLTVAPSFAYHYTVRRCQRSQLNAIDLSSWRVAMVGGELVRRMHLDAFQRRFGACGFADDIFVPVYGLAEASLAVAFGELGAPVHVDVIRRQSLERDDHAQSVMNGQPSKKIHERMEFLSVGPPLPNTQIKIVDGSGNELDERSLGEIAVKSPSLMARYFDAPDARQSMSATRVKSGWLYTGDLGYVAGGELYVVGRKSERFETRDGRKIFPEDLELVAHTVDGVRTGAVVAFGLDDGAVVLAYESQDGADEEELERVLRRRLARYFKLEIALERVSPRSIPRSPSGKIRRHVARAFYIADRLDRRARANDFSGIRRIVTRSRHELLKLGQNVVQRMSSLVRPDDA